MAKYQAVLMHGKRDAEGNHPFEAAEGLMQHSPARITRTFMEAMEAVSGVGHIEYELNATMKSRDGKIVTALGNLVFHGDDVQPFIVMISEA